MSSLVEVSPPVSAALRSGAPVVALESTIISHGLPRPGNLDAAREFEAILAGQGVTAATIALIDGVPKIGLTPDELERIATDESVVKVSSRDIAIAMARKVTGGTTVAATSVLAARAGIRVFATGGLGGVHRGASETFDESADLTVLSRTPITVVSAGVKSILDIPATLERLETLGVAVVGYRTSRFPAFWLSDSGCDLDWRADTPAEIADIMAAREAFGEQSALLVANPLPPGKQLDPQVLDGALAGALAAAAAQGVRGKAVSPFLLEEIQRVTGGVSVGVNLDIARGNIDLAAKISRSWSERSVVRVPPRLAPPASPRPPCQPSPGRGLRGRDQRHARQAARRRNAGQRHPGHDPRPGRAAPRPTRPPGWLISAPTWCSPAGPAPATWRITGGNWRARASARTWPPTARPRPARS